MNKDMLSIILVLIATILTSIAHFLFKIGVDNFNTLIDILNLNLITGAFLYGAGGILLLAALKLGKVSVVYPFFSLGYVWTAILGFVILSESLSFLNVTGIFSVMIGITFIATEAQK